MTETDGAPSALSTTESAARLRLAVGRLTRWLRQQAPGALTPGQHSALATVGARGPLRLTDLAAIEGVSPPTVTRIVDWLTNHGYVRRQADARDARCNLIALSDIGERLLEDLRTSREYSLARRLAELTADDLESLEKALPVLERLVMSPAPVDN